MYMMSGIAKGGGVFNVHDEPESPNEGACLRYESDSRNEGACYMFN